jgi:hypothetical protein
MDRVNEHRRILRAEEVRSADERLELWHLENFVEDLAVVLPPI